ncbi:MAG: sulfotransferase [Calditrichaeota bacterium]|nr:MAG: sulfotransferase [Calditrichota bacterium]
MRMVGSVFNHSRQYSKRLIQLFRGIIKPFPVHCDPNHLSCVPFFIISSGRSGTTLLRAIINQHPDVCIPPESHVLGHLVRKYKMWFRYLPWEYVVRLVVSEFQIKYPGFGFWELDVFKFYPIALNLQKEQRSLARLIDIFFVYYMQEKKPEAKRWGDKSIVNALFLPLIDQLFPNAQYILLIRDGRDVAVSLVAADTTPVTDFRRAANYWLRSVTLARKFAAKLDATRFLEIYYENLVKDPEPVIRKVYKFLNLDYTPKALEFWKNVDQLKDTRRAIHKNLRQPINPNSIGKWRQQLNEEDQKVLQNILREKLLELNYQVD